MLVYDPSRNRKASQKGITLLESLVAIVVMALGLLGVVGIQMRTLADTQTGVRRAQAVKLIEDLSERVRANPNAIGNAASYAVAWASTLGSPPACVIDSGFPTSSCTAAQLATYDVDRWLRSVRANLPVGDATVFVSGSDVRQLGVMLSWRENERAREGDSLADTSAYKAIFSVTGTSTSGSVTCPAGKICHLQYINLTQRCIPSGPLVFCSDI